MILYSHKYGLDLNIVAWWAAVVQSMVVESSQVMLISYLYGQCDSRCTLDLIIVNWDSIPNLGAFRIS